MKNCYLKKRFSAVQSQGNISPGRKGLQDSIKGVLAGYPVVNLKATLVDGSYHSVDSSEMAFK